MHYASLITSSLLENVLLQIIDINRPQYQVCHVTIRSHEKKVIVSQRIIHSKNSQDEKTCQENYINQDT